MTLWIYIAALILSFFATMLIRWIALKRSVLDIPNERSSHKVPTPKGGGLAIAIVWFSGLSWFWLFDEVDSKLFLAFLPGLLLVIIGLLDDILNIKPIVRLLVQSAAAGIALYFLEGFQKVDLGFFVFENTYLLTPLAFIGIIWLINLFNFIDGIDGYAGSEAVFISLVIFGLFSDSLALLFAVSILGFLVWNWQKAKIFMGDTGSTLLGYNVGIFAIYYQNHDTCSIFIILILSSLFWFDASLTLLRRIKNKEKLSEAHRKHAYQRIVQFGFSHQKTAIFSIIINVVLCLGLVLISIWKPELVLICFLVNIVCLYLITRLIDKKKPF